MVRTILGRFLLALAACLLVCPAAMGGEPRMTPGGKWRVNDPQRPRPAVVDPGTASTADRPGRPPSDAIILFDGNDLSYWEQDGVGENKGKRVPATWKIEDSYMEASPKGGSLRSKQSLGDCQIHIEWASPAKVEGSGQGRGNSGIMLGGGHGEIQVLDSYDNDTYPDGQAASIYGKYPPLINASRKPGEWQTYDIIFQAPRFDENNQLIQPTRLTVLHNGVVVHHAVDTLGRSKEISIGLQDHQNPVRFRNIWVRPMKGYDEK